jgi:hypothetical protein
MITSLALFVASCGKSKSAKDEKQSGDVGNYAVGTEAAKLLLARERLDERTVGTKINIGMGRGSTATLMGDYIVTPKHLTATTLSYRTVSTAPIKLLSTTSHTWTDFPNASHSAVEFSQFIKSVELEVERVAEDIALMKTKVGVTDKWVTMGYGKQMLRVYENSDVLITVGEYGDIHVYYRHTDETAKNVYEMFSLMSYDDGTTGEIRTMMIPGERYEYMYNNSNGFTDYFIAENSRGYWMNTRFNYYADDNGYKTVSFSPYIVKDGLGFGSFLTVNNVDLDNSRGDSYGATNQLSNAWYSIFDPQSETELFRIYDSFDSYIFNLYMTAIESGFVSVSSNEAYPDVEDNIYSTGYLSSLTTTKATYHTVETNDIPKEQFGFSGGYVQYDYGNEHYYGSIEFTMPDQTMSLDDACSEFEKYANSLGMTLRCDMGTVAISLEHSALLSESFSDSFEWNGYKMSSIENVEKARAELQKQFDAARAEYEAVKDFETVSDKQKLSTGVSFADLDVQADGNNSFANNTISLSGISVFTTDVELFEENKEYVLKVGLSLLDEKGEPISVNTIALNGTPSASAPFTGSSFGITVGGEFILPDDLDAGKYAAVVYIATADEGIRVSEIQKIAFLNIAEGEIESSKMHVEARTDAGNLLVIYTIKHTHTATLTATKDTYSYNEIRRAVVAEILTYGAPYHGAVLEYSDGTAVDESATLGRGTYRMVCYLATEEGLVQSYVYLNVQ